MERGDREWRHIERKIDREKVKNKQRYKGEIKRVMRRLEPKSAPLNTHSTVRWQKTGRKGWLSNCLLLSSIFAEIHQRISSLFTVLMSVIKKVLFFISETRESVRQNI